MTETTSVVTVQERQLREKGAILDALREMPIVQIACKKAGISRATFYRWRKDDASFARECDEAHRQGVDFINDMSESQLIQLIKEKKMPAIALWLRNNSQRYGAQRQLQGPSMALPQLSEAEVQLFRKALALSSASIRIYGKATKQKRD